MKTMSIRKYFGNFSSHSIQSIEIETKPLATTQFMLTSLLVCPSDDFTTPIKKRYNVAFAAVIAATQFCGLLTSLIFMLKFMSIDFEASLFALLAFIGHVILIYSFLTAFSLRHEIGDIFKHLTTIHGNSEQ